MSDNNIYISLNGKKYTGWKEVSIKSSIDTIASAFSLNVIDSIAQTINSVWPIQTQDSCEIKLGNSVVLTGYVDNVNINIGKNLHNVTITGRDKTEDLIDCAVFTKPSSYSKTNILNLARELCSPFGISVILEDGVNLSNNFNITINPSESPFEVLDKKAKELGILLMSDGKGNLVLGKNSGVKIKDSLVFGENIEEASAIHDYTNRFSNYRIETQTTETGSSGWGGSLGVSGEALDEGVTRYRPLLLQGESSFSHSEAKKRAQWESITRAANSQEILVTIPGFRRADGNLWEINKLVSVKIPPCYVNDFTVLLIAGVEFILNESGSYTKLFLKREDAFIAEPTVKKQEGLGW